jgi:hypothetical protein
MRGKRRVLIVSIGLVGLAAASLLLVGRLTASSGDHVREVERQHGLFVLARVGEVETILPVDIEADSEWGLKQLILLESGVDLRPHAGAEVVLTRYLLRDWYEGTPLYLWLVHRDGELVGAYATVTEISFAAPGIFSLEEIGTNPR